MSHNEKGSTPGLITAPTPALREREDSYVSISSYNEKESSPSSIPASYTNDAVNNIITAPIRPAAERTTTGYSINRSASKASTKSARDADIEAEVAAAANKPWHTEVLSRSATQNDIRSVTSGANGTLPDEDDYPEGGQRAWLVVLGSFLGMFSAFGFMNTIGVFQTYVSENQLSTYNESTVGWIFSIYVFLSFFGGLQIGPIFDAYGPKLLILAGSVLLTLALLLVGLCTAYWHFILVIGVLAGMGSSLIFTPCVGAVGHFFYKKRGSATGLAATGGSVGGIIFPLMLNSLLPRIGFAWATRAMALIVAICCAASVLLVRSRLPPTKGGSIMPDLKILSRPAFALTTIGVFGMEWGLFVPITFLASYLVSTNALSADDNLPFTIFAILNTGSCLGRYLPGIFADKIGRFNSMIVMLFFCMVLTLSLWLPATSLTLQGHPSILKGLIVTYALLFGFASGSNISLTPVCVGQLCKTEEYGRYYATCYCIVSLGTLTGIPIAGALIKACGGAYWGVAIFTGGCYACSLASMLGARWTKVRWAKVKY